jgi:hypothetical protein
MHTYFTIETEAAARRREFERMAAADARAAEAMRGSAMRRWRPQFARPTAAPARALPAMSTGAVLELSRVPRPVAC